MSGGWTVVDTATNKSLPVGGTQNSGAGVPYIAPSPASQDPVGKLRISSPQSLIDTDFEYGTQPTKWESIGLQNARPSVYYIAQQPLPVSSLTAFAVDQIQMTTSSTVTIANNTPIYIQNSLNSTVNQWGWIITGGTGTSFLVNFAPGSCTLTGGNYVSATTTYVYIGYFYSNSGFLVGTNCLTVLSGSQIQVTTTYPHGLARSNIIYINGAVLGGGALNVNGAYIVEQITSPTTFIVTANGSASGVPTNASGNNVIYARPSGFVEPRSFDGGVAFSSGANVPNQQMIRQTRRYFRYQSGKGLQFSTGSCVKPALFVTQIQNNFGTVIVTTRFNHNLTVGTQIQVTGCNQGYFNGTYRVFNVISPTQFAYSIGSPSNTVIATGQYRISPLTWFGANSRIGMFDQQNGMFFDFDGSTLSVVLRNSTNQISGTVSVTQGQGLVTGSGTTFTTQLQPGQFIVIRGQSYRVVSIQGDTTLYISPDYRGATISNAIVSQTIDVRIPQSQWNIDKCDGTGPSGYNIDLTRMQMWYIDYSWYGAGFIRYGLRGTNGLITYVHQIQNNNRQFEAYMRSGNMAAHYEVSGILPTTSLTSTNYNTSTSTSAYITSTQNTIPVLDTTFFNQGEGVVLIGGTEYVYYTGKTTNTGAGSLTGCIRGFGGTRADDQVAPASVSPSSFTVSNSAGFPTAAQAPGISLLVKMQDNSSVEYIRYTDVTPSGLFWGLTRNQTGGTFITTNFLISDVRTSVELVTPSSVPSLSHWGSSAIMDGLFNDDKSLIFNYGTTTAVSTASTTPVVLMAIRVAPAVDNGVTGLLGAKEIINRMQLQLESLGIVTTGNTYLINLILNGYASGALSGGFIAPIQQANGITSSLAQIAVNTNAVSVIGGESVAAAYCNANGVTTLDLQQVRDLGNSILGGGTSNTVPTSQSGFYPDGPDILYVVAQAVSATPGTILARLSWKEAQA